MSPRRRQPSRGSTQPSPPETAAAARGVLYVVGTPIGNLEDLSYRAVETLRTCALIACEDTRVTRAVLTRHGLDTPLLSCHRFNEVRRVTRILESLAAGRSVALVSDGGTPGLSDPGALLVREARLAGFRVVPIPGPSAVTALWSASGLPPGPFLFIGFLPQRGGERRRALQALAAEPRPMLFFESPHRILAMLADARSELGERACVLGREMTKIHEEFLVGDLDTVRAGIAARQVRGEFTLLVAGAGDEKARGSGSSAAAGGSGTPQVVEPPATEVRRLIATGMDRSEALRRVARSRGIPRRELYRALVEDRQNRPGGSEGPEAAAPEPTDDEEE